MASVIIKAGSSFDWDAVAAQALAWRLLLPVQRILAHLETLWPGIIPPRSLAQISALRPTRAERHVHDLVVKHRDNRSVRVVLAWLTTPGLGKRWRYLLETVFPSPAHLRQRYGPPPGNLWPLLYLRHGTAAVRNLVCRGGR